MFNSRAVISRQMFGNLGGRPGLRAPRSAFGYKANGAGPGSTAYIPPEKERISLPGNGAPARTVFQATAGVAIGEGSDAFQLQMLKDAVSANFTEEWMVRCKAAYLGAKSVDELVAMLETEFAKCPYIGGNELSCLYDAAGSVPRAKEASIRCEDGVFQRIVNGDYLSGVLYLVTIADVKGDADLILKALRAAPDAPAFIVGLHHALVGRSFRNISRISRQVGEGIGNDKAFWRNVFGRYSDITDGKYARILRLLRQFGTGGLAWAEEIRDEYSEHLDNMLANIFLELQGDFGSGAAELLRQGRHLEARDLILNELTGKYRPETVLLLDAISPSARWAGELLQTLSGGYVPNNTSEFNLNKGEARKLLNVESHRDTEALPAFKMAHDTIADIGMKEFYSERAELKNVLTAAIGKYMPVLPYLIHVGEALKNGDADDLVKLIRNKASTAPDPTAAFKVLYDVRETVPQAAEALKTLLDHWIEVAAISDDRNARNRLYAYTLATGDLEPVVRLLNETLYPEETLKWVRFSVIDGGAMLQGMDKKVAQGVTGDAGHWNAVFKEASRRRDLKMAQAAIRSLHILSNMGCPWVSSVLKELGSMPDVSQYHRQLAMEGYYGALIRERNAQFENGEVILTSMSEAKKFYETRRLDRYYWYLSKMPGGKDMFVISGKSTMMGFEGDEQVSSGVVKVRVMENGDIRQEFILTNGVGGLREVLPMSVVGAETEDGSRILKVSRKTHNEGGRNA